MAPNSELIRASPTPAFAARMLALPMLNEAVNKALDVFDSTKTRNDAMGAALRAAEASMRVAASGALPLATPIVNTVGGWGVVDEWACRGLDQVVKVAPIIKKPATEIVSTTRQQVLRAVSGGAGPTPESFTEAITARANQAVIVADFVANSRGGVAVFNAADQMLASAHIMVDNYLPPLRGDRQGTGIPNGGISIKVSSLYNKTRQRLYRAAYVLIRAPTDKTLDGPITVAMLIGFGRRTAETLYMELSREPLEGEAQNSAMILARSTFKFTKQYREQLQDLLQKQLDALKTMDRKALTEFMQTAINTSITIGSNANVYFQGGLTGLVNTIGNILDNAGKYRLYFEDMLRKAMSDYEQRERSARAAAAAASWRTKNQMERVASPPPPEGNPATTGTVSKNKAPVWHKKMMGRQ